MLSSFLGGSNSEQGDSAPVDLEEPATGPGTSTSLLPESVRSWWSSDETENESLCPSMSYSERLNGFLICFGLGFLLSFISSFSIMSGNLKAFAFVYTVGNIVALAGTTFLVGPARQWNSMFQEHRATSSAIYLGALFLTLFIALKGGGILVILPLLIVQWCAGVWYTASYIPYARTAIKGCCKNLLSL